MIWLNVLIFLIAVAGHTEVQVMLINRVHSQRMQQNMLRHLEHLHEVFILIFPPLLVWFAGVRGPALLAGGTWTNVPAGWWAVFVICGLGFIGASRVCRPLANPTKSPPLNPRAIPSLERGGAVRRKAGGFGSVSPHSRSSPAMKFSMWSWPRSNSICLRCPPFGTG